MMRPAFFISPAQRPNWLPFLILPLLAVCATLPLIAHGVSCGHDFDFHLQSWLDAAAQMRHGTLDPAWTSSAAWNAGEPRFLFYPPLSWMLGALLTLVIPFPAVPVVFTALALFGAAATMYLLARDYAPPAAALLASAAYIGNPYMLFTAFERTAYGELLAAVWMPLLLRAALQAIPSAPALAVSIALLWLSNAPAAVIGVYTVAGIGVVRILLHLFAHRRQQRYALIHLVTSYIAGGALGLALPAFYLLPAAYERRYVQVAMAIIPNMRVQDNFLFGHTGDGPHDQVLHTASLIAVALLAVTVIVLIAAWRAHPARRTRFDPRHLTYDTVGIVVLALATAAIALLLTPISLPLWLHIPELAFLQFPWRFLSLLGPVLALALAIALRSFSYRRTTLTASACVAVLFVAGMTALDINQFRQPCEALDRPTVRAQLFRTHHGVGPTDEYTPTDADNDVLRWDDPSYWLAANATAFAAGTVPNPAATIVNYDTPPPIEQTISGTAPHHLQLQLTQPEDLILNLRDYPGWQVTRNGAPITQHLQRDDGLLAIALPAGTSIIDIRWHRTWDQLAGDIVSIAALLLLAFVLMRSRTIKHDT